METPDVRETLNQRGNRYGPFDHHSAITEAIIAVMMGHGNWQDTAVVLPKTSWWKLAPDQRNALRYIADKIARALNGDPDYDDNWRDMAGYAQLIVDRLNGTGIYATVVRPGLVLKTDLSKLTGRCFSCAEQLGNAHAPNCVMLKNAGNPGGSAGG
jgi:hypothetical protein